MADQNLHYVLEKIQWWENGNMSIKPFADFEARIQEYVRTFYHTPGLIIEIAQNIRTFPLSNVGE